MKPDIVVWFLVLGCALLSTLADTLATYFWEKPSPRLFVVLLLISPMVFFMFGYVGSKFGLSIASSLTNSLIVVGPILVGLLIRNEWRQITWQQYVGMALILIGITLVALFRQPAALPPQ